MKPVVALLVVLIACAFAGCESTAGRMREKFVTVPGKSKVVKADQRQTYEAAKVALDQMDFRVLRGGAAQGFIEAVSRIRTDDSFRGSRQISMKIRFLPEAAEGETTVLLVLTEVIEDKFGRGSSGGTEAPLRDTALFEVFFRYLEQALPTGQTG